MLESILLVGTFCLPPQLDRLVIEDHWQLINRTCAVAGGIKEQEESLRDVDQIQSLRKIVYIEGLVASAVFDRFEVSANHRPVDEPLRFLKLIWKSYFSNLTDGASEQDRYRQSVLKGLEPFRNYCSEHHCRLQLFLPDGPHSSKYLFEQASPDRIWERTFYTFFLPNFEIDLRPMFAANHESLSIQKYPPSIWNYRMESKNAVLQSEWIPLLVTKPGTSPNEEQP